MKKSTTKTNSQKPNTVPEEDHNIYIKKGSRYEPVGMWFQSNHNWLGEGVWIVTKRPSVHSQTNMNYAKTMYGLDKVCDIEMPTYAELAGFHKYMQYVADEIKWDDITGKSLGDVLSYIAGKMLITSKKLAKEKVIKLGAKTRRDESPTETTAF